MRSRRLVLLLLALACVQVCFAAFAPAAPKIPQVPDVELPPLPKADETAKFKLTVNGQQSVGVHFTFEPPPGECVLRSEGVVDEGWHFERGRAVVIEFRRYGKNVFISRRGRPIGDLAFSTTGKLQRTASGSFTDCRGTFPLNQSDACGEAFDVKRELRLSFQNGTIAVEASFNKNIPRNPAAACGNDTDVLSPEFPTVIKMKGALSIQRVFNSKKGIALNLKGKAIKPLGMAYTTINSYRGEASVDLTLTRIS